MNKKNSLTKKILAQAADDMAKSTKEYLTRLYHSDNRPWVVAYSGGKDSTLLLQLVLSFLSSLTDEEDHKPIFILSSDTLVEPPNISTYVKAALNRIKQYASENNLPLTVIESTPEPDESFWGKLIGKGYPSPTRWFRWCTSSLKIRPARREIEAIANEYGSVILLLGTRRDESTGRRARMDGRDYNERLLNPHREIPNALVATPISYWSTDEVWNYLLRNDPPPWGGTHRFMFDLYSQATGGECPVVLDLDTPSCGGSRFGCWTCTVVKIDKSMEGFIESGESWMAPLNAFRNWIKKLREDNRYRMDEKRNGQEGLGPFTYEARKLILSRLLETEQQVEIPLVSDEVLGYIQHQWNQDFDYEDSALKIAMTFGREMRMPRRVSLIDKEKELVESLCETHEIHPELVESIIDLVFVQHSNLDVWGAKKSLERDMGELIEKSILQARTAD